MLDKPMQLKVLNSRKLLAVKVVHTVIYSTIVAAIFYTLYSGITKTYNNLLYASLGVIAVECAVFLGNGMRCPLTALAKNYGAAMGHGGDSLFPEKVTKYTLGIFGTVLLAGLIVLTLNSLNLR